MAKDEVDDDAAAGATASKGASKKNLILIIVGALVLVLVSVGGSIFAMKMMSPDEPVKKVAKKKAPAQDEAEAEAAAGEGEADAADAEGDEAAGNPDGTPKVATYLDFEQPFVVNFQDEGQLRYLQISVSVMVTNAKVIEEVKRHMPLIRNNLVMLFSAQTREAIITRDGKEKVRKDAEVEVQKILKEQTGQPGIKSLYFTSFVMQ